MEIQTLNVLFNPLNASVEYTHEYTYMTMTSLVDKMVYYTLSRSS